MLNISTTIYQQCEERFAELVGERSMTPRARGQLFNLFMQVVDSKIKRHDPAGAYSRKRSTELNLNLYLDQVGLEDIE